VIQVEVIGDREVVARIGRVGPKVHLQLVKAMQRLMIRLQAYVKGAKLSGQLLHVRTGAGRRSVAVRVEETPGEVAGSAGVFGGPTLPYMRAHEYGFSGAVTVKEHLRRVKQAFGRPIDPVEARVSSHTRQLSLDERRWLRSALDEFGPAMGQVLAETVQEAVQSA